jgi:SCY1-like protein 1
LDQLSDDFPEDFFKMKIMPELMKSVEFGGGGPKALGVVLKIAAKLSNDEFESKVIPFIVRVFGNPDRALRVCLLDGLPLMIDRLPQKVVNDKIFPNVVSLDGNLVDNMLLMLKRLRVLRILLRLCESRLSSQY